MTVYCGRRSVVIPDDTYQFFIGKNGINKEAKDTLVFFSCAQKTLVAIPVYGMDETQAKELLRDVSYAWAMGYIFIDISDRNVKEAP